MKGVDINVPFVEKASRLEVLIIRWLYMIPVSIVMFIFGIVMYICFALEWLAMLILGKRISALNNILHAYVKWVTPVCAYIFLLTDERPPIIPSL